MGSKVARADHPAQLESIGHVDEDNARFRHLLP